MKTTNYSKKVLTNFRKPKNMGEIQKADAIGTLGNPICGDVMKIYLKLGKNSKKEVIIKDIKFQTMGCAAAIATSSMITQLAKGKTLKEAKEISNKDVASALEGLPPIKMHCSNLAADCLRKTILEFEKKSIA